MRRTLPAAVRPMKGAITPISRWARPARRSDADDISAPELGARVDPELLVDAAEDVADGLRGEERLLRDLRGWSGRVAASSATRRSVSVSVVRRVRPAADAGRARRSPDRAQTGAPSDSKTRAPRAASRRRVASPSGGGGAGPSPAASGRARTASAGRRAPRAPGRTPRAAAVEVAARRRERAPPTARPTASDPRRRRDPGGLVEPLDDGRAPARRRRARAPPRPGRPRA